MSEYLKQKAKNIAKKATKTGGKKLLVLLAPYLPAILLFLFVFFMVAVLAAATYSAMAPGGYMTDVNSSEEDKEIINRYESLTSIDWNGKPAWNVAETYLVDEESYNSKEYYPKKLGDNLHALKDKQHKDFDQRLKWGTVHSVCLFWAYNYGKSEIPDSLRNKVAEDLHPVFYYIKRTESRSVSSPKGSSHSTWDVYLLVESRTIYGHTKYHYKSVTETHTSGGTTVTTTTWQLEDSKQLWPDKYKWIKEYLVKEYKLQDKPDDVNTAMNWALEGGEGFTKKAEWYEWMFRGVSASDALKIRGGIGYVKPEIMNICKQMETKYGVPWWLIAGVISYETRGSFATSEVNKDSGAMGLGQITPETWQGASQDGNGDGVKDPFNQWDNIATVAMVLIHKGYNPGADDSQLLNILAAYEGDPRTNEAKKNAGDCLDWVRQVRETGGISPYQNGSITFPVANMNWDQEISMLVDDSSWRFGAPRTGHDHAGIDVPADGGTPVTAVTNGVVVSEQFDATGGGNMLVLLTGDGIAFTYMHLQSYEVSVDKVVSAGEILGYVGDTGNSAGFNHLHFEVHEGAGGDPNRYYGYYTATDPVEFFTGSGLRYQD